MDLARPHPAFLKSNNATIFDTAGVLLGVLLPTVAKGVIMRRPWILAAAEALDLDRRAVRTLQRIRDREGSAPLLLRVPGRNLAVVLDASDVHRILLESPHPFATSTPEKRAALAHFEPKVSLVSTGEERADRRRWNEEALQPHRAVHQLADHFASVIASEATTLQGRVIDWRRFADVWFRIVRRVIFGDAAASDNQLSLEMAKLRRAANWAFLRPQRAGLREQLHTRIRGYLARAEAGSLAGMTAGLPATRRTAPEDQISQWLFAFDAAGMAAFRALALLATHPAEARQAQTEAAASDFNKPFLRATLLESVRLWPTTPLILREALEPTQWSGAELPAGTGLIIYTPFFHRDSERLPWADEFCPELWLDGKFKQPGIALVPFSEGNGECPGREVVLLMTTLMISDLIRNRSVSLQNARKLSRGRPLPGTLNHFGLRFTATGS